jgi:hypothetical protein
MPAVRIPGFCALCRSRCGCISVVEDGRLIAVEPDPTHPTGRNLCIKGKVPRNWCTTPTGCATHFAAPARRATRPFAGVGFLPEPSPQTPLPERVYGRTEHVFNLWRVLRSDALERPHPGAARHPSPARERGAGGEGVWRIARPKNRETLL